MRELGAAWVALPCTASLRQSWLGLALTSGLLHHSHCHTAQKWDVSIQGHHPARKSQGKNPSLTPFLMEGMRNTEPTSQSGCFIFAGLGFCQQNCSTGEITAGEIWWSAKKHKANQTKQVPGVKRKEITPKRNSQNRNGGSWEQQPVHGLATQTPNPSAYFCWVEL